MADGNSDIGFARLCLFRGANKGHTKVLKLSAGLRTQSVECSKLGKTRIITDASCGMVKIPDFAVRFAAACLSGTFKYLFLIILLINAKHGMLIAAVPFYPFITGETTGFPSRSRSGVIPPAYPLA